MVVRTKEDARLEFSKNLNAELDRLKAPRRGRPEWLRKELREIVSRETCRKWLGGLDMPDQAHLTILITKFGLNEQLLRTGTWGPSPSAADERFIELQTAWPSMDERAREAVMATFRAVRPPEEAPAIPRRRRG